jgi:fatty acid desaturase
MLSSILLLNLAIHYALVYFQNGRKGKTVWMALAFALMLFANIELLLGMTGGYEYVIGNILYILGTSIILVHMMIALRK